MILKIQKRMTDIEDRKIAILLEIGDINNNYNEKVSKLNFEYEQLNKEYFQLQLGLINQKNCIESK